MTACNVPLFLFAFVLAQYLAAEQKAEWGRLKHKTEYTRTEHQLNINNPLIFIATIKNEPAEINLCIACF